MGFRGLVTTSSLRRDTQWPEWFVGRWGTSFHLHAGSTLCVPRHEIKNVWGFIEDYHSALVELKYKWARVGTKILALHCAVLWDCGGISVVSLMPDEIRCPDDFWAHGDHCEHQWEEVNGNQTT